MRGKLLMAAVSSDTAREKLVYSGLACVAAKGSAVDRELKLGQSAVLLGFFSVNLKRALDAQHGCHSVGRCEGTGRPGRVFRIRDCS